MLATLACYDKSGKAINLRNEKNESIIDVARKKFSSNSSAESPIIDFLYSCGAAPERSEANVYKVIRENEKNLRTHIQRLIESRIDAHENYFNSIKTDIEKENIGSLPRGLRLTSQEIIKAYDKENAANIRYGGVTGDIYFQAYKQRIAIPSVAEFFASLKANPLIADRKNAAQFQPLALSILNVVFDVLGEIRQHIAKVSKTKDAEKFGQRIFHAYLHDPVLSYAAWREYMAVAFKEMIKNALTKSGNSRNPTWKDLLSQLQKAYGKDSVEITSEQDGELNFTFSVPNIGLSGSFTFHVIIDAPYNEKIDAKLIDRLFNEVQWGYSEFDPITVSDTDASEQPPATLRFAKIDCEHAQYDITLASQMASSLANAILWDGKSLAEFQRMLYVLLRQVSVSSTFSRGQGAIVTILLESVARAHGLKLTWVEQLKPDSNRLHMTPDILALSGFDDAACLEEFKKNISLTRIQTDSESSGNSNSSVKKNKTTVEYH